MARGFIFRNLSLPLPNPLAMIPLASSYLGTACRLFHGTSIPFLLDAGTYRLPLGLDGRVVDTAIRSGEEERLREYLRENAQFFLRSNPEPRVFGSPEEFGETLRPSWLSHFPKEVRETLQRRNRHRRDVVALLGFDFPAFLRERWEAISQLLGAILYMDTPSVSPSYQLSFFDLVLYGPTPPERGLTFSLRLSLLEELCSAHIFLRSGVIPKVLVVDAQGQERALYDPWPDLTGRDFSIVSVAPDGTTVTEQYMVQDSDRPRVRHDLDPDGEIRQGTRKEAVTEANIAFEDFHRSGVALFLGYYLFLHYELTREEILRLAAAAVSLELQEALREIRPGMDEEEAETAARWLKTPLGLLLESGRVSIALELLTGPQGRN